MVERTRSAGRAVKREIRSVVEICALEEVERRRGEILLQAFAEDEAALLAGAPVRTISGNLALKKAVRRLLAEIGGGAFEERQIAVGRDSRGRPVVSGVLDNPALCGLLGSTRLRVSISHTRDHACGLAAAEREGTGRGRR